MSLWIILNMLFAIPKKKLLSAGVLAVMAIKTIFEKSKGTRLHDVDGTISFKELADALTNLYQDPDFDKSLNALCDLRGADISSFTADHVRQIADLAAKEWGRNEQFKTALVVSEDFSYGMARMYELLLDSRMSSQIKIFRDMTAAREWLNS
jgi:uncharacterized protein with PIN domain